MHYIEITKAPAAFVKLLAHAKAALGARGQFVHIYPVDEYATMRLWVAADYRSGFAVKPDGDIVSVWSIDKGRLADMLAIAKGQGGSKLDCFEPLAPVYERYGFRVVGRDEWADEYAPDGWDYAANGRPAVTYLSAA